MPIGMTKRSEMAGQLRTDPRRILPALPLVGAALLPKLVCPACWPAYTALLGSVGIEFVNYTPYLLPLTVGFLAAAVGSLALLARRRHRIEPFLFGLAAAVAVVAGKFALDSDIVLYAGIAGLVATSLIPWRAKVPSCCT